MDKILVEIFLPSANMKFDAYIPRDSKMGKIKILLADMLTDLSERNFTADGTTLLCDADSGKIYNLNIKVDSCGLKNGSRLMLI